MVREGPDIKFSPEKLAKLVAADCLLQLKQSVKRDQSPEELSDLVTQVISAKFGL